MAPGVFVMVSPGAQQRRRDLLQDMHARTRESAPDGPNPGPPDVAERRHRSCREGLLQPGGPLLSICLQGMAPHAGRAEPPGTMLAGARGNPSTSNLTAILLNIGSWQRMEFINSRTYDIVDDGPHDGLKKVENSEDPHINTYHGSLTGSTLSRGRPRDAEAVLHRVQPRIGPCGNARMGASATRPVLKCQLGDRAARP